MNEHQKILLQTAVPFAQTLLADYMREITAPCNDRETVDALSRACFPDAIAERAVNYAAALIKKVCEP